jgi:hypothetical protein
LRVPFHQFDEGAAVLGLNLELDDDQLVTEIIKRL